MTRSPIRLATLACVMTPVLLLSALANGNAAPIPRPPPKPVEGPFVKIEQVPGLERAELVIPKKLLPTGEVKEKTDAGMSPTRTAIAGVAMSGAVALLGLQFMRRRSGTSSRMPLMLIAGGIGLALLSAAALADIAIPGQPKRPRPGPPPVQVPAGVPVTIKIVDVGDHVTLRIAPEHVGGMPIPLQPPPGNAAPGEGPGAGTGAAPIPPPPG